MLWISLAEKENAFYIFPRELKVVSMGGEKKVYHVIVVTSNVSKKLT